MAVSIVALHTAAEVACRKMYSVFHMLGSGGSLVYMRSVQSSEEGFQKKKASKFYVKMK